MINDNQYASREEVDAALNIRTPKPMPCNQCGSHATKTIVDNLNGAEWTTCDDCHAQYRVGPY